ncbi:MAG: hypothetical protein B9S32_04465 [Verrucomicrobia bacterium Tous-C9LFEB]|nr:MAG: hypothetical protein B9S32_04465 [Verrucomicrobia bacterium Tous-C9LFEB]
MLEFHLIGNSHLDPVWLWDWREGLNEGLVTVRTILNLMDEDPEMTYMRGESAIYEHIEQHDPVTFQRIKRMIKAGRWDVVGGSYIQPDTNLAGVETLARQYTHAQRYFQSRFGHRVTAGWQADSFGHTAGLPEVLAAAGIDSFAFTRPDRNLFPLSEPAFWWEGAGGARILSYRPMTGWYGTEGEEIPRRMDGLLEAAKTSKLETVACFYGLGDHGGGPSRRQLADIRAWAAKHPEVRVIHSGLHRFFAALKKEVKKKGEKTIPTHRGELNFCLRGCYSSMAKFKFLYRRTENLLARAERTDSVVAGLVGRAGADLTKPWAGVLFNSFHDILPGSSIERAYEDQMAWMGGVLHRTQEVELRALNELALRVDTKVAEPAKDQPSGTAALVWNPHPQPFTGHIEYEGCLDYRPLWAYENRAAEVPIRVLDANRKPVGFQEIATEHSSMPHLAFRKRVLIPVTLPAFGWNVVELGYVEGAPKPKVPKDAVQCGEGWIANKEYRVETKVGAKGIQIRHRDKSIFGEKELTATVYDDPWGSWGGMNEEKDSLYLTQVREEWTVTAMELLEKGPERATLWVRLAGAKSRIDLSFSLLRGRGAVDVAARVHWDERSARLKLAFPVGDQAEYEVPGAVVKRGPLGEVPGGRWVRVKSKAGSFGLTSDALYNFDTHEGTLRATVVRASRYANDVKTAADALPWLPAADNGELRFKFVMTAAVAELPRLALELEQPPVVLLVPSKTQKGDLPRIGSLAALEPAFLRLLAFKRAESGKGFVLRVQSLEGAAVKAKLTWQGRSIGLGTVRTGEIVTWLLSKSKTGWKATRTDATELV